jgi:hypothetical protein
MRHHSSHQQQQQEGDQHLQTWLPGLRMQDRQPDTHAAGDRNAAAASNAVSASALGGISIGDASFSVAVSSVGSSSSSYGSAADICMDTGAAPDLAAAMAEVQCAGQSSRQLPLVLKGTSRNPQKGVAASNTDAVQSPLLPSTKSWSDTYNAAAAAGAADSLSNAVGPSAGAPAAGNAGQQQQQQHIINQNSSGSGASTRSRPSDVLRCLLLFLQFWAILASMQLQWPPVISKPLAALGTVLAAGHAPPLNLDCLVPAIGLELSKESLAVVRVVALFCMPFVMLTVLLLLELACWCGGLLLQRRFNIPRKPAVSFKHLVTCRMQLITLAAVFFFYPSLVRTCLQVFVCLPVHSGDTTTGITHKWAGYANMQCGTGAHAVLRPTVGIIGVLFVCLGMPVGMAVLLLRSSRHWQLDQHSRQTQQSLLRFGSLMRCYRGGIARAWESMIMVQTAACVAITVFAVQLGEFTKHAS